MSFRVTTLKRSLLLASLLIAAVLPVSAQLPNAPIVFAQSAITTSFVPAPNLGGTSGGSSSGAQWLKVELHYGVVPQQGLKFVDSAEFRVWIEGRDLYAAEAQGSKDGIAVALTGRVTYMSLPASRDAYAVFFVPPTTLDRYSARGPSDFDRPFNIHAEAFVNGTKVDYFDKNKENDANWYQALKPLSGLVFRQDQSPFITADPDRYPPIKQQGSDQ